MSNVTHEFVTIDMRGLKASLIAHASERRCSVSAVVREAVMRRLGTCAVEEAHPNYAGPSDLPRDSCVKLSVRMKRDEARRIDAAARAAGLSRGAYLIGLTDGIPVLANGGSRSEITRSLITSCSVLATMGRNIHELHEVLRRDDAPRSLDFVRAIEGVEAKVAAHLRVASAVLAELRPLRAAGKFSAGSQSREKRKVERRNET